MTKIIHAPLVREEVASLRAGDSVLLTGTVYTGRDAAHKRLCAMVERNEALPFDLKNQVIYYAGPCPAKPGEVIGSCGPTTSYRMDAYAPMLCDLGLIGMIGKGQRGAEVVDAIKRNNGVYFAATGGAGALIASSVKAAKVVAFPDLGTEAIRELRVENLPLIVAIDAHGGNLYEEGPAQYRQEG
ncbi:MAG: Fe-S-containing hydro-lyase [Clostridia bacterium]|nr:Fe-S-containing hydro-lyase [Clostridia bacterium]